MLYADHIDANGTELFRAVCDQDLEGIVAKRKDGLYTPEETTWVKIKNPRVQPDGRTAGVVREAAVGGGIAADGWQEAPI